jgi:hypothetical protein
MPKSTPDSNPVQLDLFSDAVQIPLTKGYIALVDPCDADLAQFKWTALESEYGGTVYAYRQTGTKLKRINVRLHRVIFERMAGRKLRSEELVDHENQTGTDCRRSNLRLATKSQNSMNSKLSTRNKSGYKGVSWDKNSQKWIARIRIGPKYPVLGYFDDPVDAHVAYCAAAREHYGEFANGGDGPLK